MIPTYTVAVERLERCGDEIVMVRLEKPDGYDYRAGQWLRLTVDSAEGPQTRTLSHAASPHDAWIEVATRRSPSAFKQALFALSPGDAVEVTAAGGRFTLPESVRFAVLVGGVGITPIRSMLREALAEDRAFDDALIVDGNRDKSCEPYLGELMSMTDRGVRVVRVLEHVEPGWSGESGFITADMLRRYVDPADGRPFILSGPPVMVVAMGRILDELEVAEERRFVEAFGTLPRQT